MNARAIERRLGALEQVLKPVLRRRYVWWEPGDPEPQAEPGEQLTIISWMSCRESGVLLFLNDAACRVRFCSRADAGFRRATAVSIARWPAGIWIGYTLEMSVMRSSWISILAFAFCLGVAGGRVAAAPLHDAARTGDVERSSNLLPKAVM